jgi:hypothetical protein
MAVEFLMYVYYACINDFLKKYIFYLLKNKIVPKQA